VLVQIPKKRRDIPALTNRDHVALFNTERRRYVCSQVLVSFLITRVLGNKVQIFSADDQGTVHFCGDDTAGEDSPYKTKVNI